MAAAAAAAEQQHHQQAQQHPQSTLPPPERQYDGSSLLMNFALPSALNFPHTPFLFGGENSSPAAQVAAAAAAAAAAAGPRASPHPAAHFLQNLPSADGHTADFADLHNWFLSRSMAERVSEAQHRMLQSSPLHPGAASPSLPAGALHSLGSPHFMTGAPMNERSLAAFFNAFPSPSSLLVPPTIGGGPASATGTGPGGGGSSSSGGVGVVGGGGGQPVVVTPAARGALSSGLRSDGPGSASMAGSSGGDTASRRDSPHTHLHNHPTPPEATPSLGTYGDLAAAALLSAASGGANSLTDADFAHYLISGQLASHRRDR